MPPSFSLSLEISQEKTPSSDREHELEEEDMCLLSKQEELFILRKFRNGGFAMGWIIQLLSLIAISFLEFGIETSIWSSNEASAAGVILSMLLAVICWVALALWPVLWMMPFLLSMTSIGASWIESLFSTRPSHRTVFLVGVYLFSGISTGSFLSMIVMDAMYEFTKIPVAKLLIGLAICLGLCFGSVFVYDIEEKRQRRRRKTLQPPPEWVDDAVGGGLVPHRVQEPRNDNIQRNVKQVPSQLLEPLLV